MMARWHGDETIELLVAEPDCDAFYLPEGLGYPAVSLSVDATEDDYWAAVGFDPTGDALASLAISANVVSMTGASAKWGCWGERDPEVAVFSGFPDAVARAEWCERFGPFLNVAGALESYLPAAFAGQTVPTEFAATLTANYAPQGDSRA